MSFGLLKMFPTNYSFINHIYLIYMYKEDLTLNNFQRLIFYKTQPTNHLDLVIVLALHDDIFFSR